MRGGKKRQYKGRTFTRERVIVTGPRMEVQIYPVFQGPGVRRKRCRESSEIQKHINERNSRLALTRIAYLNFSENDLALHLTYSDEPESIEEAERLMNNYIKRARRLYRSAGIEMKYIKRTERGKKNGRVHHHLFLTGGVDRDALERLWGKGRCNSRRLQFEGDGIDGLAAYIAGAGKPLRDTYRRWSCSRNCIRPEVEDIDGRMDAEAADALGEAASMGLGYNVFEELYPGWECVSVEAFRNETNRGWYTYAVLRRREPENAA